MGPRARQRALLALAMLLPLTARAQQSTPAPVASAPGTPELAPHELAGPEAGTILGRDVFDSKGENVGQLVDVVVDREGKPIAGVIEVGGFLGVGTRRVAIAWHLLRFVHDPDGTHIVMDLTFDSAAAAPEFEGPDNTLIVIDRPPP